MAMIRLGVLATIVLTGTLLFGVPSASACEMFDELLRRDDSLSSFLASPVSREGIGVRANLSAGWTGSDRISPSVVVLVPWDYGSDCKPFLWNDPNKWTPPNRMALYTGTLRPPDKWIDKLPTFDVFRARSQPVYAGGDDSRASSAQPKPYLTVEEFLDLYRLVPTFEELHEDKIPAVVKRLEAWTAAHPALARRYPANDLLDYVHRIALQPVPR